MKSAASTIARALVAGLALTVSAQEATSPGGAVPPGSLNGPTAVRTLGDRLPDIASDHNMSPEQLAELLRTDLSAYITPERRILYICPPAPREPIAETEAKRMLIAGAGIPLDDFLDLESLPGAEKTIYLDFDGHHSVNNAWGHNIVFPPYDTSGNSSVFTDNEKADIIAHWLEVSEDFAPFNINVTTRDPGLAALTRSGPDDTTFGIRVVMTQVTSGFGSGTGGIAFLGSFRSNIDDPCFAFNKGLGAGPMTASHEAGHGLSLRHDGLNGSEYHPGSSGGSPSWGPIMGAPFGRQLAQWSKGDYPGATQSIQQDFNVIASIYNGVQFVADDHPDYFSNGTPLISGQSVQGLIGSIGDVDAFSFTSFGGDVSITINTVAVGPNLDASWRLYRDNPVTFIEEFNPPNSLTASKTYTSLPAGNYTIVVEGAYQPLTNGPVSNYGSAGNYTIDFSQTILQLDVFFDPPLSPFIAPDTVTPVTVSVQENGDTLIGIPTLSFQRATDASPTAIALTPGAGNTFTGQLPEFDCGDDPEYWLTAEGVLAGVVTNPVNGVYQALVGQAVSVYDSAETDIGWTVSGNATDGQWERAVPANFGRSDPPADFDSSGQCWLTDNAESNSDVDGGQTILTSPQYDFSTGGTVSYAYWMNDETNPIGAEDFFRVEVSLNGGSTWSIARNYTPSNQWRTDTIDVGAEFGNSSEFRLRFIAADNDPGDVLECAVDAIAFDSFGCTQEEPPCIADTNGDGVLSPADFSAWVAAFNAQSSACDQNGDGLCTAADFSAWVANYNAGCP